MTETNMEKEIFSEEDLKKIAGGAGITLEQLEKVFHYAGLVSMGTLGAMYGANAGGVAGGAIGAAAGVAAGEGLFRARDALFEYAAKNSLEERKAKEAMKLKENKGTSQTE